MKKILLYGLLGFVGLIAVCTVVVIAVDTGGGSSTVTKEEAQLMKVTTQEVFRPISRMKPGLMLRTRIKSWTSVLR